MNDKMVNGVVGGAVVEVDRRESESKGCDVFYPFGWLPLMSTRTCCGASIEVATTLIVILQLVSHLHPAARQFCRSTYTITDNTIK
jgi:hypothetical protein